MRFEKPPLSFEEQAALLLSRGLVADPLELVDTLHHVNYYRLSGYLYPFREPDETYRPGTTLDTVWRRYTFDRRLRLMVLDAIERVEVAVRTQLVYEHVHRYGPFGYTDPDNLPKLDSQRHRLFLTRVGDETARSKEVFVKHFKAKYGDQHTYLPLWMVSEIIPYGVLFTLFSGVEPDIKRAISRAYAIPDKVLSSWLGVLNMVRNICAHHGRLWNRELGVKPLIPNPNKHPQWHCPHTIPNSRVFAVLTILKYLIGITAPKSHWPDRVRELLDEYKDIPRRPMGFIENMDESPLWKKQ